MNDFFPNLICTLSGVIVGAILTTVLTYGFQKRLLKQQLDFQKQLSESDAALRQKIYEEWKTIFTEFRNMLNTRASQIVGNITRQ